MASYGIPQMHTWVMSANKSDVRPMFGQVSPQEFFFQNIFCYRTRLLTILDLHVSDLSCDFCQNA